MINHDDFFVSLSQLQQGVHDGLPTSLRLRQHHLQQPVPAAARGLHQEDVHRRRKER